MSLLSYFRARSQPTSACSCDRDEGCVKDKTDLEAAIVCSDECMQALWRPNDETPKREHDSTLPGSCNHNGTFSPTSIPKGDDVTDAELESSEQLLSSIFPSWAILYTLFYLSIAAIVMILYAPEKPGVEGTVQRCADLIMLVSAVPGFLYTACISLYCRNSRRLRTLASSRFVNGIIIIPVLFIEVFQAGLALLLTADWDAKSRVVGIIVIALVTVLVMMLSMIGFMSDGCLRPRQVSRTVTREKSDIV